PLLPRSRSFRPSSGRVRRRRPPFEPWRIAMRVRTLVATLASVGLAWAPAAAQEVDALRKEIEKLQKQLQSLTERLQRMESQPAPSAPPAVAPGAPSAPLTDLARPRQPFSLYAQRGGRQLLFDLGIAG